MAEQKKQHYVPKCYLKNFANGKLFNVYSIKNGLKQNVSYENQCYKNYFYGKDKIYENKLGQMESKWSASIQNIIQDINNISLEDEQNLKEFCCFQYLRTEYAYQNRQASLKDMVKQTIPILCQFQQIDISNFDLDSFASKYVNEQESKDKTMRNQIDNAERLSPTLNNLELTILKNNSEIEFITSDNPVIIGNKYQKDFGLGLDCIGFYMLIPLSPQYYILLSDSKIYYKLKGKKSIDLDLENIKKLNLIQYKNSLINVFSKNIPALQDIENTYFKKLPEIKKLLIENYNKYYNNFLSNFHKDLKNKFFTQLLECINPLDYENYFKRWHSELDMDIFDIIADAVPFIDNMNYNLYRSASLQKVKERISFMRTCTEITKDLKENINKQEPKINQFEKFLEYYYKN